MLSGYAPALISGYLQKPDANVDAFSACMEDCGKSDRCKDSCTLSLKLKARKRVARKKAPTLPPGAPRRRTRTTRTRTTRTTTRRAAPSLRRSIF